MAHHRRAWQAAVGATLLTGGLAAGALAPAGASTRPAVARPRLATPTTERLAVTATIAIEGQHVGVSLTGVAGPTMADLHVVAAGTALEMRRVGGTVYLHFPPGTKTGLPKGKTWGSVSLAALDHQLGVSLPGLSATGAASPLGPGGLLGALAKVTTAPPKKVGVKTVHGIATTEYRADLDVAKIFAAIPPAQSAALKQLAGSVLQATSIPVLAWVDGKGQVVQLHVAVPISMHFAGAKIHGSLALLAQGWDFGVPVHVTPPPAAQVAALPLSALGSAGATGLGGLGGLVG